MPTQSPEGIANLALAKLAADPITTLAAPVKPNEKLMALLYPHHRDTELRKHRWLFALAVERLTPTGSPVVNDIDGTLYRFQMPNAAVRAVRTPGVRWQVRGRQILDESSTYVDVKFVMRVSPALFDDLFSEAVACRMAMASCEKITKSTDKMQDLKDDYKRALDDARVANAIELGPEDVRGEDDSFDWLLQRNV